MGKLNILQHKSWNVYSKKNISKVRRDEENARIEEQKKDDEHRQKLSEKRLEILRSKKRVQDGNNTIIPNLESDERETSKNSSFKNAYGFDSNNSNGTPCKRHKKEPERDPCALYLGETMDGRKFVPWYAKDNQFHQTFGDPFKRSNSLNEKDVKLKKEQDPMFEYNKFSLKKKENANIVDRAAREDSSKILKAGSSLQKENISDIDKLREQRIKRERKERQRINEFFKRSSMY